MAKYQSLDSVVNKISFDIKQSSYLEDTTIPLHLSNKIDIRRTLELLNTTNDVNFQIKLFSVLSASLMLNKDANFEVIIKYSSVYDRINNVLAKGLARKSVHALNFLSTLLYVDVKDDGRGPTMRRTLALYAKNMTRISGCLGTMADMFTSNCMIYHDTWKALCLCLAAACSGSDLNQSYCSHMIPVCNQRSNQTNIDIFLVLQSLLLNHNRNMELFLKCNGISIFTRELLHYDKCLQLLITVVQYPTVPTLLLRQAQVLNNLQDFLRTYGPSSQIGQKAVIILKHIELRLKGSGQKTKESEQERNEVISNVTTSIEGKNSTHSNKCNKNDELDDTATLMKNIVKEVFSLQQNQIGSFKKPALKTNVNSYISGTSTLKPREQKSNTDLYVTNTLRATNKLIDQQRRHKVQRNNDAEQTFSVLKNYTSNNSHRRNRGRKDVAVEKSTILSDKRATAIDNKINKTEEFTNAGNDSPFSYRTISNEKPTSIDPKDFKPMFSSTPKNKGFLNLTDIRASESKLSVSTQTKTILQRSIKIIKKKHKKIPRNNKKIANNKTLSSKFFSAINETCTTLVKTVASIFKKNEASDSSKEKTEMLASRAENNCSYSFLSYMQKRDSILNKSQKRRNKDNTDFSLGMDLCDTCDTNALRKKMTRDEHLKQTIKKLKLGINLYGCDFKKISRTLWPRESYMTPTVLYNLYRKLLLK